MRCSTLLGDPSPRVRAAALRSLAQLDPEGFVTVLSGLDADSALERAGRARVGSRHAAAGSRDCRDCARCSTIPTPAWFRRCSTSLAKLHPPDAAQILIDQLDADDPVIRAAAPTRSRELKPAEAVAAACRGVPARSRATRRTSRAPRRWRRSPRTAPATATPLLTRRSPTRTGRCACVRRAAEAARSGERRGGADSPGAHRHIPSSTTAPRLINPPVSTQAYIDTDRGTIQIELAVLDAPLTVDNFVTLARQGFFDGMLIHRVVPDFVVQAGDPRGDGEGGPGYTIRDELNERPYLRGTVGMALDWADTGGSQFFITHSPQPHLDAKYTVFGRVLSGMDVVDQIEQWDVIRRVRIWDGTVTGAAAQ